MMDGSHDKLHEYYVLVESVQHGRKTSKNIEAKNPDYTVHQTYENGKITDHKNDKIYEGGVIEEVIIKGKYKKQMGIDPMPKTGRSVSIVSEPPEKKEEKVCDCKKYDLVWGDNIGCNERKKVIEVAKNLGVDVDNLLIYQPETQEDGYDMILALIENKVVSCVVIDSQSAATPKAVLQGEMGDATIGLQARLNSKFCMKVKGLLDNNNCTLFIISQMRDNIGGMGESTTTTGGKAIKYYADVRWKVWKMNDKINELNKTTVDVIKNKLAAPFGQAKINILWGEGFDKLGELIDYAVEFNFIKKGGAWFTFGEDKFQGMERIKDYLEENPEILLDLEKRVLYKRYKWLYFRIYKQK